MSKLPARPNTEKVNSKALHHLIAQMPHDVLQFFALRLRQMRIDDDFQLFDPWESIGEFVKDSTEHINTVQERFVLLLQPFFVKEVKGLQAEAGIVILRKLSTQFFWSRIPLWRIEEDGLYWHPDWVLWLGEHSLLVRDVVVLRMLELGRVQGVLELRQSKLF